jgi:PmbA protein
LSLLSLVEQAVALAQRQGATGAECTAAEGNEFSVSVRKGEVEQLKEAGSRGMGIRVLQGLRAGSAYTSDLSPAGIERMVASALDNARVTGEDPFNELPALSDFGKLPGDLHLAEPEPLDAAARIALARRAEAAALAADARITNTEGGSFETHSSARYFANSRGFSGEYQSSSCGLGAFPIAELNGKMERDYWWTAGRSSTRLEDADFVGRKAAERTLRRLGSRKVPTQKAPVVFEPRVARSLLAHLFEAVSGDSLYQEASFLHGKLGQSVAAPHVNIIDDSTIPGLWGTSPFDAEGLPSRRTAVIENGILKSYLLNTYTGRKLGLPSTGNASRGLSGATYVGSGNFFLSAGDHSPSDILRQAHTGLYVTELLGHGVNVVNGDYSQGAAGLWIENGQLAYPVSEITIAGNLRDMLHSIAAIGNDLEFRGAMASPTILIREMTISGN